MTKVSIISHDVSNNALGRADVLARLLAPRYAVEIVGPASSGRTWAPLDGRLPVPLRVLPADASPARIAEAVDGDVAYSVKARRSSLGAALVARRRRGIPVIADVDDWELAFYLDDIPWALRHAHRPWSTHSVWSVAAYERRVAAADAVTVPGTWLQRRFGGLVVPHARAEPATVGVGREAVRRRWGLADEFAVMFLGSVRPHKIGTVLAALDVLADPRIRLVITDPERVAPERDYLIRIPPVGFDEVQQALSGADAVVLAQSDTRTARAQVPAKVFDAMAAGVPVVASRVSDLPRILDGCGVIVEPDAPHAIAAAVRDLVQDPRSGHDLAAAARRRFQECYSLAAVSGSLCDLVDGLGVSRQQTTAGR